jgi:hypothetical protein
LRVRPSYQIPREQERVNEAPSQHDEESLEAAYWKLDENRGIRSLGVVILAQFLAEPGNLHPNYGLLPRIVRRRLAKNVQPNRIFFQLLSIIQQRLFDEVEERPLL